MKKKKIAIIIDCKGWAFDNIANQIKKNIEDYEFDIISGTVFHGNMLRLFLFCQKYDYIHFLWRGYISLINTEQTRLYLKDYLGMNFDEFLDNYIAPKKIGFSVCDHLYLEGEEKWRTEEILKYTDLYSVTSQKLYDIYSKFEKKPKTIIHDGVDLDLYIPKNIERFNNIDKIRIGWVGNSKFKDSFGNEDLKGVETIIKPAIKELMDEGYNIELNLADRNIKQIKQEDMPDFYNSIDLYVCASKTEGTPLTILESMAMGIPVISTDVGVVREALGPIGKKYILEERTKECLKSKIKEMIENRDDMKKISEENLEKIKNFDWKNICKKYKKFFDEILQ